MKLRVTSPAMRVACAMTVSVGDCGGTVGRLLASIRWTRLRPAGLPNKSLVLGPTVALIGKLEATW